MSYRTKIEGVQIFGNNEYYQEYADFLISQGIEIDEEGCYEGEITDVQGLFRVIDRITKNLITEAHKRVKNKEVRFGKPCRELADFSDSMWLDDKTPVLVFDRYIINTAYVFLPYQVYKAVQDKIEDKMGPVDVSCWFSLDFKLKDGETIRVSAG